MPVVGAGTKAVLEEYFADQFPMANVWDNAQNIADRYDEWHSEICDEIGERIEPNILNENNAKVVGAKFLNTYMHQLMKYEVARPLWDNLHLVLDARVFRGLRSIEHRQSPALTPVRQLLNVRPYTITYADYLNIQNTLLEFINELNGRVGTDFNTTSRIELNILWV